MENDDLIIDDSRRNNFLSLKDKAEILQRLDEGAMASCLAREYGVSKSTISRFKKRKDSIQKAVTTIYPNNTERRTLRGTFHPKMEQALYKWYLAKCNKKIAVSTAMLREQAHTYYNQFQESNYSFAASTGWIKNFKKRFGIKKLAGEKSIKRHKQPLEIDPVQYEEIEYLIETVADDEPKNVPRVTHAAVPRAKATTARMVSDSEAHECLETIIRWSMQNQIDTLYLTMLRNLKSKAIKGKKS